MVFVPHFYNSARTPTTYYPSAHLEIIKYYHPSPSIVFILINVVIIKVLILKRQQNL